MSSVENAKNFVDSWNDPELRRFAEEYAAEQTLGFAQLAIDQAERIKRLWAIMEGADEALAKFTGYSFIENAIHDGHITPKDMKP